MNTDLQIQLAKEAGQIPNEKTTWEQEYKYHLGMVDEPLPFERFRMKYNLLQSYFAQDPEGRLPRLDKPIHDLCVQLGY